MDRSGRASGPFQGSSGLLPAGGIDLEVVERDLIAKALQETRNNRSRAARLLGITRSQLYSRLQKHGLAAGWCRSKSIRQGFRPTALLPTSDREGAERSRQGSEAQGSLRVDEQENDSEDGHRGASLDVGFQRPEVRQGVSPGQSLKPYLDSSRKTLVSEERSARVLSG